MHRLHQGIARLVPADRFFQAAREVLATLQAWAAENVLAVARGGVSNASLYLTRQNGSTLT